MMSCCKSKPQETEAKTESNSNENKEVDVKIGSKDKHVYFYLVRHGETDYNKQGKIQGHMDIPLNENGFNQAKSLGQCITKYVKNINAVVASPVLRGKQTGEEIYKQLDSEKVTFKVMEEFAELHYGDLVDTLLSECNDLVVDLKENKWASGDHDASFPGDKGESFNSIINRMKSAFLKLGDEFDIDSHVIIATHSQCIEAFLVYLNAFGYKNKEIRSKNKNCTISTIVLNVENKSFKVEKVFEDLTVHVDKIESINQG